MQRQTENIHLVCIMSVCVGKICRNSECLGQTAGVTTEMAILTQQYISDTTHLTPTILIFSNMERFLSISIWSN